ncbi:hypothetical protein ACFP1Z_02000 [Streptomyces gamaensis]|uniref:L-2-amino-thiazoline-4-carboxylic acid hydrolase n=1 Tax=Streptomyces gamaensis TaxID=1763542 RepID=A0ABW0YVW7_9ACTN
MSRTQQYWWLHDARWYQEVAKRFGFDAANEINKEAIAFVARRIAQNVAKAQGVPVRDMTWDQVVEIIKRCPEEMWPPQFVDYRYDASTPGELTTSLERNFALTMSRTAGTLDTYQCPCLELRAAWHEGLGLDVESDSIEGCLKDGADACTYKARFRGYAPAGQ